MQILQYRLFTSHLSEDHTAVSGFRGSTSIATHRGDFNCVVQNARLIHLVDPSAALVIPDSHRNIYSVRHAQHSGQTVILRAQAGLLPYSDPDLFVPFLEDKSTGLWLLPLLPPSKPDPKIPTPRRNKIFLNNAIPTKNMQTIATQSLTPRSPSTFLDTALSMERSQQVKTTPSIIKTAIPK